VEIEVPRDTNSSLEPQIIKKWQRRLTCIDEIVLSLTAKGLTTGEISAHFADVCGNRPLQLITAAEARGQQRLAEMNRQVLHNLDSIITALNDPEPGKAKHAG
jgi:transposase-like protein